MQTVLEIWDVAWPIIIAIFMFLLMIVIHEFGHFIAAKILKVRVNEFAVGFGPTLFKWQGKETKYAVRLIPFGGFCAMEGEDENSDDPKAFCNKKAWKRLIIILAGAFFNLIFGLVIVMIMLSSKEAFASTTIYKFSDDAISNKYGLQVNDTILKIEGRKILTANDLSYAFTGVNDDGLLDMVVKRDGKTVILDDVKFDIAHHEEQNVNSVKLDFWVYGIKNTPLNFISESIKTTVSYVKIVCFSVIDLISGKYGISAISGPVGVTAAISDVVRSSLSNVLPIIALITVNLGVFNLFPIPALDGGRALFIFIEMIARKPIKQKYESVIHAIGFIVLIVFMVLIAIKDIYQLF